MAEDNSKLITCDLFLKLVNPYSVLVYESFSDLGEIRVWLRADFQSGSRVLKKDF